MIPKQPRFRSTAHLKWIRSHRCAVEECFEKPIEAAHVRSSRDGGTGFKPGDQWTVPLCHTHHHEQHALGEPAFERIYQIDMKAVAKKLAADSPALKGNT